MIILRTPRAPPLPAPRGPGGFTGRAIALTRMSVPKEGSGLDLPP
jgi:hypothetical protein